MVKIKKTDSFDFVVRSLCKNDFVLPSEKRRSRYVARERKGEETERRT